MIHLGPRPEENLVKFTGKILITLYFCVHAELCVQPEAQPEAPGRPVLHVEGGDNALHADPGVQPEAQPEAPGRPILHVEGGDNALYTEPGVQPERPGRPIFHVKGGDNALLAEPDGPT